MKGRRLREAEPEIRVAKDIRELSRLTAGEFVERAVDAVERREAFTVALSGGSTPGTLYDLLANPEEDFVDRIPWKKSHFFWGDERHVPPDHLQSNYRMANERLLSRVPVPQRNVHRVRAEDPDADRAAENYGLEIRDFFRLRGGDWPRFDFVLLGLGADGHTASLFPGTSILHEKERLVAAEWISEHQSYRISMTPPVLNHAAHVAFLVSGERKADAVREVIQGEYRPDRFPAQLIRPVDGRTVWYLDQAAARRLNA